MSRLLSSISASATLGLPCAALTDLSGFNFIRQPPGERRKMAILGLDCIYAALRCRPIPSGSSLCPDKPEHSVLCLAFSLASRDDAFPRQSASLPDWPRRRGPFLVPSTLNTLVVQRALGPSWRPSILSYSSSRALVLRHEKQVPVYILTAL